MDITVKKKIAALASQTEIARRMKRTPQMVSLWIKGEVPAKYVRGLCEVLDWNVTPHEINPHIYPNPTDGLPSDRQSNAIRA